MQQGRLLLDIALSQLTLGRAYLQQAAEKTFTNCPNASILNVEYLSENEQEKIRNELNKSAEWLNKAIAGLREAGAQYYLPRGLLSRAMFHRLNGDFVRAKQDLQEVYEIAEGGGMRLHSTDYHLEMARVLFMQQKTIEGQAHITEAEILIRETGYHRRDAELTSLKKIKS